MCCGSYRGRLRAIKLFLLLHGSAEYIKMGLWWLERIQTQTGAHLGVVVATGIE